jgi:Flp pilus assembly protein TadG
MKQVFGGRRRRQHGQSLVEFALVFPIFMLLLAGAIQFGMILWGQNTLNQLVRDTGRYAATRDCSAGAVTESKNLFATMTTGAGGPWTSPTSTVTYYKIDPGTLAHVASACPDTNQDVVFVNVTGSYKAPIFFPLLPGNGNLTSSTDFRVEPAP